MSVIRLWAKSEAYLKEQIRNINEDGGGVNTNRNGKEMGGKEKNRNVKNLNVPTKWR